MLYHHGFREAFLKISVENAVIIQLYQVEMNEMGIKLSLFLKKSAQEKFQKHWKIVALTECGGGWALKATGAGAGTWKGIRITLGHWIWEGALGMARKGLGKAWVKYA